MGSGRWSVSVSIYGVEDLMAVPASFLMDTREDRFVGRSAIAVGGIPRRAYKGLGSIDGSSVTPFAVPSSVFEHERMDVGNCFTRYDDGRNVRRQGLDLDDLLAQVIGFEKEVRAGLRNGNHIAERCEHVWTWGCISATVPDGAGGCTNVRALREVIVHRDYCRLKPLAFIACQLEPSDASGGEAVIWFSSGSSIWSESRMAALWSEMNPGQASVAARSNAEWLATTLGCYLWASSGRQFEWDLDTNGEPESAGVIAEVLHRSLGARRQKHGIRPPRA